MHFTCWQQTNIKPSGANRLNLFSLPWYSCHSFTGAPPFGKQRGGSLVGGVSVTKWRDISKWGNDNSAVHVSWDITLEWEKCCYTSSSVKFSNFQCRFVHILPEGDLLVCQVIVI